MRSNSTELMYTLKVSVLQGISFMCQKENILIWTIAIAQISYSEHVGYAQTIKTSYKFLSLTRNSGFSFACDSQLSSGHVHLGDFSGGTRSLEATNH